MAEGVFREDLERYFAEARSWDAERLRTLRLLREGMLVITRTDRLARSMKDLQYIVHDLKGGGVSLKATKQPIDTGTAAGKAILDMFGVLAAFETNLRKERQARSHLAALYESMT